MANGEKMETVPPREGPRRNVGAAARILLLGVGAAVTYGMLQDQVTAHLCVEYFTIGHVDFFNLGDPTLIAFEWGLIATWWAGLLLGIPVALVARVGRRRPRLAARDLLRPTMILMACIGLVALIAGVIGYFVARAGGVYLLQPLASEVPQARQVAFLADLWAHTAAYAAGALGGVALCVWTWRRRGALLKAQRGAGVAATPALHTEGRWEAVALNVLTIIGACSLVLGVLFVLAISALSGL